MAAFCVKHGYSGRRTAAELLARLRAAPAGTTDETLPRPSATPSLAPGHRPDRRSTPRSRTSTARVVAHLGEHPDAEIFTSLPRSGQINAAQMLAEWGDCRQAYDSPDAVAALAGVTPVTKQSGKHRAVHFRWACNKRFRNAITTFADNSRHASPWAAQVYTDARARGHDHPTPSASWPAPGSASSGAAGHDRLPYDPTRHGNRRSNSPANAPQHDVDLGVDAGVIGPRSSAARGAAAAASAGPRGSGSPAPPTGAR